MLRGLATSGLVGLGLVGGAVPCPTGLLKATDTTAPYSGSWVPSQSSVYGPRRVTAKAIDAQGLSATSSVTVTRVR